MGDLKRCPGCGGKGEIENPPQHLLREYDICSRCQGHGKVCGGCDWAFECCECDDDALAGDSSALEDIKKAWNLETNGQAIQKAVEMTAEMARAANDGQILLVIPPEVFDTLHGMLKRAGIQVDLSERPYRAKPFTA